MPHAIANLKHEPDAVRNGAVRIDRRTKWGNEFVIGRDGTRDEVIALYRAGEVSLEDLAALAHRRLACHCHPKRCHGEVLARAAVWAASVLAARSAA